MKSFKKMIATVLCVAMIMGALNITDVGNPCISTEAAGATKVSSDASGNVSGEASAEASGEASADASGDEAGNVGSGKKSTKVKATKKQKLDIEYVEYLAREADFKKKGVTYKLNVSASGKGKLSFKVLNKGKKYIKVNKKGKVTIKKGCKAGTYKIKVTAAAKGKYKKAVDYAVVRIFDTRKMPVYVTYAGKTVNVGDFKYLTNTTATQIQKSWGKPTTVKTNTDYCYDIYYTKGKTYIQLTDQLNDGEVTWTSQTFEICDKNAALDGIKVGMSKKQALKRLIKLYGKSNIYKVTSKYISVYCGGFLPICFDIKNGKVKRIYYWHS